MGHVRQAQPVFQVRKVGLVPAAHVGHAAPTALPPAPAGVHKSGAAGVGPGIQVLVGQAALPAQVQVLQRHLRAQRGCERLGTLRKLRILLKVALVLIK